MAALTPVASTEAFLDAIQKSGLLAPAALAKVQSAAASTADPKLLARDLLKAGTLTKWQVGQLLHGYHQLTVGNYKLLDQLESGAIGRVYLAEHASMGRRHLLKVLSKRHSADPATVKRFLTQAEQACGLDHRNISHVYDVNQDDERTYIVGEYVEGQNLQRLVETQGALSLGDAFDDLRQVAEGLLHAHAAGVVHGDLKPANLLRDAAGTIKILDIGQAGLTGSPASPATNIEETGETPNLTAAIHRAPEVVAGRPAERASDIYSFGSVLCFLLTGKPAANAAAATEQMRATAGIPGALVEACAKVMAEQPEERPGTIEDAWNLLAEASVSEPEAETPNASGANGASDSSQGKKPRVAQRLEQAVEAQHVSEIVADDETAATEASAEAPAESAESESPFGGLVITPRPREVKQPAEAAPLPRARQETKLRVAKAIEVDPLAGIADPLAETAVPFQPEPDKTIYTPLILAGVLGGGALIIVIAALVWTFSGGKRETKLAQNAAPKAQSVVAKPAAPPLAAESNPDLSVEKNPEITPEANPVLPAAEPPPPPPASAGPPPPPPPTPKKDASAPPAAPPAGSPAKDAAKDSPVAKLEVPGEPKAAPQADAKDAEKKAAAPKADAKPPVTPPAKAAPKAPASPFRGFTAAVNLPELPETAGQASSDSLQPLTLGPCKLDAKAPLTITLKGGLSANRDRKLTFELAPKPGQAREWEFALNGGESPVTIATLSVKDGSAIFQWTEKAVEQPQPARYLSNCALELTSGTEHHTAALRIPIEGDPLAVEVDRRIEPLKWQIPDLPPTKQVFIEVAKCEGFEQLRVDPSKPVNLGETVTVWTGPNDKSATLAFRIDTKASAKVMSVSLSPQVKLEGSNLARPYSKKELTTALSKTSQEFTRLQNEASALKAKKPSPPKGVSTADFNRQLDEYMKTKLPADIAGRQTQLEHLSFLTEFAKKAGEAKIHFRVYHETEDGQVVLLKTYTDAAPKAKGKKK